jgi:isoleucyl-tRNA synthetase
LSTWYVRLNRERFNQGDKEAIQTLKFVLNNFSKIIAPVIPFVSEKIYQTVYSNKDSVHLQSWPMFKTKINEELLNEMKLVREIVSQGLKQRDQNKIGLKWPLGKAKIKLISSISKESQEIIKEQLNVKELEFKIETSKVENGFGIEVVLDTTMNKELEAEGYSREVARQVQAYRKELGLNKEDLVNIIFIIEDDLKEMFEKNLEFLIQRVNAKKIEFVTTTIKERFINKKEFNIKDKKGVIVIDC